MLTFTQDKECGCRKVAPHYARTVEDYLNVRFNNKWIGRGSPIQWPTRSPDLSYPDFYLWGFLKNTIYKNRPTTKDDMQERITVACFKHSTRSIA